MCSLEVDMDLVHEMNGHGALQRWRDGPNLDIVLLHPLRHKMAMITVLSIKEREAADGYVAGFLGARA